MKPNLSGHFRERQKQRYGAMLVLGVLLANIFSVQALASTDWYLLKAHGDTIGKVRIRNFNRTEGGRKLSVTEISNTNRFSRDGEPFAMTAVSRFVEDPVDGSPQRFTYRYRLGQQDVTDASGEFRQDSLDLRMVHDNRSIEAESPIVLGKFLLPGGAGIEKAYQAHFNRPAGSRFRFQTLTLGVMPQVVETEVTLLEREKLALAPGEEKLTRKFAVRNPADPDSTVYEWRDAGGKLYKAQSPGNGTEMLYASQRAVRNLPDSGGVDLIASSKILTNRIPQPRMTYEALYRIAPLTGQSLDLGRFFPEGDAQTVVDASASGLQRVTSDMLILKVVRREPDDVSVPLPIAYDTQFLQSTPYLQSSDPMIDRVSIEAAGDEKRAYYAARRLQQWVYHNIEHKDLRLGFASARDTLLSREGDCTEHAVLLAAMARAIGIPSRVAVGLIYTPEGGESLGRFVYHMWTEVYIGNRERGNWIPLDATHPELQADATHIKIADSPLAGLHDLMRLSQTVANVMGRIKIDVLKALSPAQSVVAIGRQSGVDAVEIPKLDLERFDIRTLSGKAIKRYRVEMPPATLSLETADGLFTHGVERLSKGFYHEAASAFAKAVQKTRRPVELYRLGEKLAAVEMYVLAARAFEAAGQEPSLSRAAQTWLRDYLPAQTLPEGLTRQYHQAINMLQEQAEPTGALTLLREITRQTPGFAPAYWHLGEAAQGKEAGSALNRAAALQRSNYRYLETLGDVLLEQRQYALAAKTYKQAADVVRLQPIGEMSPALTESLLGKMKLATGSTMLAQNKRNAAGWLETGKGLMLQGRSTDAAVALDNALALNPNSSEARLERFQLALVRSDWKTLERDKSRLSGLSASNAKAASLMGQYQMRTRQYAQAVRTLQRAISLAPAQADAYLALSQTYERMAGRSPQWQKQAETALRQGLAKATAPRNKETLQLALGELLIRYNKAAEAKKLSESVLARNPLQTRAYLLKGKAQLYLDDLSGARETLETADALNPNDPEILAFLGHTAMEEGREMVALDYFQRAYKQNPSEPGVSNALRNLIGELQLSVKKPDEAIDLSGDEHDYLVQLLNVAGSVKRANRDYFKHISELLGPDGRIPFSVGGLQDLEVFRPFQEQIYNLTLRDYNKLKAMQAPGRFAALHTSMMQLTHEYLSLYQDAQAWLPVLEGGAASAEGGRHYKAFMAGLKNRESETLSALSRLKGSLPEAGFTGLLYEAQAQDLVELDMQTMQYLQAINSKVAEGAKTPETKAQQMKKAPSVMPGGMPAVPGMPGMPNIPNLGGAGNAINQAVGGGKQ